MTRSGSGRVAASATPGCTPVLAGQEKERACGSSNSNNNTLSSSCSDRRTPAFMSHEEVAAGKCSRWFELEISGMVRNVSPSVWQLRHLTALYMSDNSLVRLPSDISQLAQLVLLDLSHNQLQSVPPELGELVNLRELLLNHNQLHVLPCEIGKLFQLQRLELKGNPLRSDIMSVYMDENGSQRLLSMLLDNLAVNSVQPPQRPWIPLGRPASGHPTCVFTVMCYNVLCEKYATRQMYGYCPNWALDWEYRKKYIMQEIRNFSADIITLQEVQTSQFYTFFLPQLQREKYEGIFSPKSRAKTMSESERKYVDGCAIFWRTDKFSLVKEHLIEFNQLAMANAEGSDDMLNRVMTKDNIGLAAMLESRDSAWEEGGFPVDGTNRSRAPLNQRLLVCTAHIHWDPEFCDVKLIQTMMLIHEVRQIVYSSIGNGESTPQLLLCGDLNSLPESGVVEFIVNGRIPANHADFKELGYRSSLTKISEYSSTDAHYTHPFRLRSSYSSQIMPYTNYTHEFKGIIDYIFHSSDTMSPLGVLGPLDSGWLQENRVYGCPHPHVPSDHFSLLVELEMSPSDRGRGGGVAGSSGADSVLLSNGGHHQSRLQHR